MLYSYCIRVGAVLKATRQGGLASIRAALPALVTELTFWEFDKVSPKFPKHLTLRTGSRACRVKLPCRDFDMVGSFTRRLICHPYVSQASMKPYSCALVP